MRLLLVPFALFALLAAGEEAATEESSTPDEANAYYEKPEAEAEPISEQDVQAQAKAKEARKKEAEKYSYCEYDNCYELLGVKDTSGPIPIKRAYRKLAAEWHPDKCPSGDIASARRSSQSTRTRTRSFRRPRCARITTSSSPTRSSSSGFT